MSGVPFPPLTPDGLTRDAWDCSGKGSHSLRVGAYISAAINMSIRRPDFASAATPKASPFARGGTPAAARRALSEDQRMELKEAFDLFDTEKSGRIDYHELKVAMRSLGFNVKKAEVLVIMERHDAAGSGSIGFDEFVDIMAERIASRSPEEELQKAFQLFDEDSTGRISFRNLRRIAKELGENLSEDELQAMIDEFDLDRDGEVSKRTPSNAPAAGISRLTRGDAPRCFVLLPCCTRVPLISPLRPLAAPTDADLARRVCQHHEEYLALRLMACEREAGRRPVCAVRGRLDMSKAQRHKDTTSLCAP